MNTILLSITIAAGAILSIVLGITLFFSAVYWDLDSLGALVDKDSRSLWRALAILAVPLAFCVYNVLIYMK